MSRSAESPVVTRCRCGHEKADPSVLPVRRYSFWGVMCLLMGYTARPVRIDFSCATCGAVFDSITNRTMLERFRYDEPRPADK
jgi:hypothetical protein